MKFMFSEKFKNSKEILFFIKEFDSSLGTVLGAGNRNIIKLFDLNGEIINIKSFKVPNLINKIAYKYFRKSKAKRSFEYANVLLKNEIGTPQPIAYFENCNWLGLKESYYISKHLSCDLTFRELIENPDFPDHENILRQFTKFTFDLHEKGIEFLDHSPGNTLIKKTSENQYKYFLVDLNRMNFNDELSYEKRIYNLRRLSLNIKMIRVVSNEYAKLYNVTESLFFEKLKKASSNFNTSFQE
jgi:hypothetical protein